MEDLLQLYENPRAAMLGRETKVQSIDEVKADSAPSSVPSSNLRVT